MPEDLEEIADQGEAQTILAVASHDHSQKELLSGLAAVLVALTFALSAVFTLFASGMSARGLSVIFLLIAGVALHLMKRFWIEPAL